VVWGGVRGRWGDGEGRGGGEWGCEVVRWWGGEVVVTHGKEGVVHLV